MTVDLEELYRDLHRNPELSFAEHRTSTIMADQLRSLGFTVQTGIADTGVVGVLENGAGPTVLLRADMDALPVTEATGLPYASTVRVTAEDQTEVGVMHACGHDIHMTCLIGAAERLIGARAEWSGTLVVLFQPAEEHGGGAQVMVDAGLYDLIPRPDIVLGQHVTPFPSGTLGAHPGPAMAAVDTVAIRMFGRGGHGSRPETTIDPVVMAASTVMRLQTIVSREISSQETAVLTVGSLQAGTKNNIIPADAVLGVSMRSFTEEVRQHLVDSVERVVRAEAQASAAVQEPEFAYEESYPVTVNEPAATERTLAAFRAAFGSDRVLDPGPISGSEDVGVFATAAGVPLVYWLLGGGDAAAFAAAAAAGTLDSDIPSNHSPYFAPLMHPTIETGVEALVIAAREWLGAPAV